MSVMVVVRRLSELASSVTREEGQALVEYALLVSLVALTAAVAVQAFGVGVYQLYSGINSVIP